MATRSFRDRLRAREVLIGPMITLSSPEVVQLMAGIGFDWLFIDTEHTPIEPPQVRSLLQAAGSTPCLVRLPSSDSTPIAKALDLGADGIIVPQVNSADQARHIVEQSRYAPVGRRGRGLGRAHRYGLTLAEYSETANDTVCVVVQAEHTDAVRNIESILDVPGVDAVLVGPYDLASSLGHIGDVNHPNVRAAIERVGTACFARGIPCGMVGVSAAAVRPYIDRGYSLILVGIDVFLLGDAAKALLKETRG
jgi:2-keto-3-deoxy-L-rhamnonate aldolase RhmA